MLKFDHFQVIDRLRHYKKEDVPLGLCLTWIEKWQTNPLYEDYHPDECHLVPVDRILYLVPTVPPDKPIRIIIA